MEEQDRLLQAMTLAIAQSQDFHSALGATLAQVCQATGWKYGEAWIPRLDGSALEYSPVWYASTSNLEKFRKLSETLTFPPNIGLPGRVWLSKQPEWIRDVSLEPDSLFFRSKIALESGLKAGLGIPILTGDCVLAVLVFFMFESRQQDERLIKEVSVIATKLSQVFEQKRVQEVLNTQYRILELQAEGVTVSDENGLIFFSNSSFDMMFGYEAEELIGKHLSILSPVEENASIFREISLGLHTQRAWCGEWNNCKKDGTPITTYARICDMKISGKKYWIWVWENITSRKQAEKELQESKRRFATLIDSLPGIAFSCGNDPQWTMKYLSEGCLELTGYKNQELLTDGFSYNDITHSEDFPKVLSAISAAIAKRETYVIEYRIRTKWGKEKWVWEKGRGVFDDNGKVLGLEGFITDITDRKRTEEALRQAERKYRSIFENAVEGIFQTTINGKYLTANPMLARIYGYDSTEELLLALTDIEQQLYVASNRRTEFMHSIQEQGAIWGFESQVYRKDGSVIWISENAYGLYDLDGKLVGYEGTVVDITERKQAEATIHYQAFHDLLTSLPNRTLFNELVSLSLKNAARNGSKVAVMFLDLDRFKKINDTLGHAVGDRLLQSVAERLKSCLREGDTVSRWGGDEFTILLPQIASAEDAGKIAQRIIDALKLPFYQEDRELNTSTSIGIALYPENGEDVETLLKNADFALYKVKEEGRNNYQFYMQERDFEASAKAIIKPSL